MIRLSEKLTQAQIDFELYHHRTIYTNKDALVIKKELGFSGTETKCLYLRDKQNYRYIFLTFTTKRSDFKKLSQLIGQRISIVSADQMEQETGQKPGAVSPFGYDKRLPVILDEELLSHEKIVFAPGRPDQTMVVKVADLDKISKILEIKIYLLPFKAQE